MANNNNLFKSQQRQQQQQQQQHQNPNPRIIRSFSEAAVAVAADPPLQQRDVARFEAPPGDEAIGQPQALVMARGDQDQVSTTMSSLSQSLIRTVNPGDRVNIPCSLSNAGGSIQFAKDEQPIILDSGCAHCQLDISNEGQASLTINRVSIKDQGHWQCWRLDSQGKVKQKIPIIQLVVTNAPELPILIVNDKELLGGNNLDATITVKENEMVNFKCLIKGASTPVDYVHWMLDSSQNVTDQSQLMLEYSQQDNNYITQSILRLNATKSMNLKSISCLSNHQLWLTPMTVTAFLNVLYEPSFTISREPGFGMPVSEGMTVILKCEIDSNPSSSPIWIKDADNKTAAAANQALMNQQQVTSSGKEASGEPILLDTQEDGSVIFSPAQRSDSGWYRCKTENKYGNFSSFGYFLNVRPASHNQQQQPPASNTNRNHQHFGHQQSAAGSRVMAPNQPAARVSSSSAAAAANNQQQLISSSNIMNNDQPAVMSPSQSPPPMVPVAAQFQPFTAIQQQHTGPADAKRNQVGCPKDTRPDGFPVIDHPVSVVRTRLGRQLTLPLRFCCQPGPSRVFWIHRHLAMIPGRMFGPYITREIYPSMNSFYCYESTFEIESVKPEDIGTVYVFVSNDKGHAGAQIHIQLAAPADSSAAAAEGTGFASLGSRFHLVGSSSAAESAKHQHAHWLVHWTLIIASSLFVWYHHTHGNRGTSNNPSTINR